MAKGRPAPPAPPAPPKVKRPGMLSRTPEERRQLGRLGGLKAQSLGKRGVPWTKEQAREAGRQGGIARARNKRG